MKDRKRTNLRALALIASLLLLAGCGSPAASGAAGTVSGTGALTVPAAAASSSETAAAALDASVSKRDASGDYDASGAVRLSPGDALTITSAGTYVLSGTYENVMLTVDAGDDDKVQLVLENAVLTNAYGPAIFVRNADKVFLTAAEGTENTISDGAEYEFTDGDTSIDAAVFSRDDLTFNGAGSLTILGNRKHAVVSRDDLVVTAKDLTVRAAGVGLNGRDSVVLSGASVSVLAGTDGIRSDSEEQGDRLLGFVSVTDSTVRITAGGDGIQAETAFVSEGSSVTVTSGGAFSRGDTESGKGIKAGASIAIGSGTFTIDSPDDAIHTNGTAAITGGTFTIRSGDDGIHADVRAEISGGVLDITAHEGVEATYVLISGGEITIAGSDDGVNAAHKADAITPTIEITGGTVTVTMGSGDTDGIDSNGNLILSGGTVYVNAGSPFDYDGSVSFTGGTVYVNGQQVTSLPNQMMGGRGGMQGGWQQNGGAQGGRQRGGSGPRH